MSGNVAPPPFILPKPPGIGPDLPHGQTCRRCSGPGRARPGLFVPGAGRARARAGRHRLRAARRPRGDRRGMGGKSHARYPARQSAQGYRGETRIPAAPARAARASSIGWRITPCRRAAWCCACACAWASISAKSASASACVSPARRRAHDAGAGARARAAYDGMTRGKGEAAREAGVSLGRHRRADRRRHVANGGAAAGAGRRKSRSGFRATGILSRSARRRRYAEGHDPRAAIRSRCSTASPARAKPKSISRRWRTRSAPADKA